MKGAPQLRPHEFLTHADFLRSVGPQPVDEVKVRGSNGKVHFVVGGAGGGGAMNEEHLENEKQQKQRFLAEASAQRESNKRLHLGLSAVPVKGGAGGTPPRANGKNLFKGQSSIIAVPPAVVNNSARKAAAAAEALRKGKSRLRTVWSLGTDDAQAVFLWGKCNNTDNICYCCICGWPIIPDNQINFPGEPVGTADAKWGQSSAEHELYASKGYRYIGLYWNKLNTPEFLKRAGLPRGFDENVKNFYRKEMMWSHWYCNNAKNDVCVIKWTKDTFDLEPHYNNIRYIINTVWNGVEKKTPQISRRFLEKNVHVLSGQKRYSNLIEYFLNITEPICKNKLEWDTRVLQWKNNRFCAYVTRLKDMIANLHKCCSKIFPEHPFNIALRKIINERTENPYGTLTKILKKSLTEWPPNIPITQTRPPAKANFDICIYQQKPEFWNDNDDNDPQDDGEYIPSESEQNSSSNESPNNVDKLVAAGKLVGNVEKRQTRRERRPRVSIRRISRKRTKK